MYDQYNQQLIPGLEEMFNEQVGLQEEVHYLRPPELRSKVNSYDIKNFYDLLLYKVPEYVQENLRARNMKVQSIYDAGGDFNLDYYSLRINKLPRIAPTPQKLFAYIRTNFNDFVDTSIAKFNPYSSADGAKWFSPSYAETVINIDMLDNGAVVAGKADSNYWIFSTITAPSPGEHPVSGHRMFALRGIKDSEGYIFSIKGADRPTNLRTRAAASFSETPFIVADWLWWGIIQNLAKWIESEGGKVVKRPRYWARQTSDNVYYYLGEWRKQGLNSPFNKEGFKLGDIQ